MQQPQLHDVIRVMKSKKYKVFDNDNGYDLNIVGIRTLSDVSNKFDDWLTVFYRLNLDTWIFNAFPCTTDPGLYWLNNPMNKMGTAILMEGQYRNAFTIGRHHNKYTALVQNTELSVIRDYDRDSELDYDSDRRESGWFGINIHRSSAYRRSVNVDKWSAGCQVLADPIQFKMLIDLCKRSAQIFGNSFTYTLLNEKDFK